MSFKFEYLFLSSLGFVFLNGEAITSAPCTVIFIYSKGGCVDTTLFLVVVFQSLWNILIFAKG